MRKSKLLWGVFFAFMLFLGMFGGYYFEPKGRVAIRVGQPKDNIDYDLRSALDFLKYQLEKDGLKVVDEVYGGELYPKRLNDVDVNIFVRGYFPFFDSRMNEKATDIFYLHRTSSFYREEMRNFDYYLLSQKKMFQVVKSLFPCAYFAGGAVPHKRLEPNYKIDVLYIYEDTDAEMLNFLTTNYAIKVYSGIEFMRLDQQERENVLASAKVVMYDSLSVDSNISDSDQFYIPYAVYDIISYGRPVLTRYRQGMEEVFRDDVYMYSDDKINQKDVLALSLAMSNQVREERAGKVRERLFDWQKKEAGMFRGWMKFLRKNVGNL